MLEAIIIFLLVTITALLILILHKVNQNKNSGINEELRSHRQELGGSLNNFALMHDKRLHSISTLQSEAINNLTTKIEQKLELIAQKSDHQLEKMRQTVDEKLQSTLEKRLSESFSHVSRRLEEVHKGLGEMQHLAVGVGDLKKVLTNVKTRGTWGEVQLNNLLDQILSSQQYCKNVAVTNSTERVEFAVKIPTSEDDKFMWLPIDAKFPIEDYQKLIFASEQGDVVQTDLTSKNLINRIKNEAKKITDKYISPPDTTNFAIMYLPIEGLYAEIARTPGLIESLQTNYRVTVAGPTTITAILTSFHMGFATLTIQKRTSEIAKLLIKTKEDFGKFGHLLEKTRDKLVTATNELDKASQKSRSIERTLSSVDNLIED